MMFTAINGFTLPYPTDSIVMAGEAHDGMQIRNARQIKFN